MFRAGDLVGFLDSPGPQLALIQAVQGSKYKINLGFKAKTLVVPKRHLDVIAPLPHGVQPPSRLGGSPWEFSATDLQTNHPSRREWGAAWVLFREVNEKAGLGEFADLVLGSDTPLHRAACWLALHGPQLMFRIRQGEIEARSSEDLKRLRQIQRRQRIDASRRQQLLDLFHRKTPFELTDLDCHQQQWIEQMKQLAAERIEPGKLAPGCREVLQALHLDHSSHDLHQRLVQLGQTDPHQLPAHQASRWSSGFSQAMEEEAAKLLDRSEQCLPGDDQREDLCHLRCVTIDDADTRDIDDGLSLERLANGTERIWIHIADPGRLIEPGSCLDNEAKERGSSLYLAQGIEPMFPSSLSTGPFSLRAGRRNPAWSTWVELDQNGSIESYGICRSWVKPVYRLSYDDADDLIDLAPPEEADLADLDRLLKRRKTWREQHGALVMELPEGRVRSREGTACIEISEPSPSRLMVAEAMILAGAVTAQFGIDRAIPLPFRSQLPADLPSPAQLDELPEGAVRFAAIKRCLSRGLMGTKPAAHFSLGLPAYVQATSPIRRYGDLVVQRQILACLDGASPLQEDELQELVTQVDLACREGISISREDQRHWQQVWFADHSQEQWPAQFLRWLRPQDGLGLIRIDSLAMDVAAGCPPGSSPGDRLTVTVVSVDPVADQLQLRAS